MTATEPPLNFNADGTSPGPEPRPLPIRGEEDHQRHVSGIIDLFLEPELVGGPGPSTRELFSSD